MLIIFVTTSKSWKTRLRGSCWEQISPTKTPQSKTSWARGSCKHLHSCGQDCPPAHGLMLTIPAMPWALSAGLGSRSSQAAAAELAGSAGHHLAQWLGGLLSMAGKSPSLVSSGGYWWIAQLSLRDTRQWNLAGCGIFSLGSGGVLTGRVIEDSTLKHETFCSWEQCCTVREMDSIT